MLNSQPGPTLLGFDVILVGTILDGVAAFAVFMAIYAAVTVKDPMAKRVKSLNDRREELKAGIVTATAKKRASLVRKTDTTDAMKEKLEGMKVLQEEVGLRGVPQQRASGYRHHLAAGLAACAWRYRLLDDLCRRLLPRLGRYEAAMRGQWPRLYWL